MNRRRYRRGGRRNSVPMFLVAFGLGLFLALFCSVRLVLFFAAIALIYLGFTYYSC